MLSPCDLRRQNILLSFDSQQNPKIRKLEIITYRFFFCSSLDIGLMVYLFVLSICHDIGMSVRKKKPKSQTNHKLTKLSSRHPCKFRDKSKSVRMTYLLLSTKCWYIIPTLKKKTQRILFFFGFYGGDSKKAGWLNENVCGYSNIPTEWFIEKYSFSGTIK